MPATSAGMTILALRTPMPFDPTTAELSRALYEHSPMPVRDIAALHGVCERSVYRYAARVRVLRDPYSAKPYVLFYVTKRVGGGVADFDAIKLLKFAAPEV